MKNVIITIVLFAICIALVVGSVLPISEVISSTGDKVYMSVKRLNDNIKE